jgi:hypothetical protein
MFITCFKNKNKKVSQKLPVSLLIKGKFDESLSDILLDGFESVVLVTSRFFNFLSKNVNQMILFKKKSIQIFFLGFLVKLYSPYNM